MWDLIVLMTDDNLTFYFYVSVSDITIVTVLHKSFPYALTDYDVTKR